ncbi:MAG: CCA tRNA nucleotidyltransferase [Thermoproteota archaeon]|jgi:tRNA nucleotidyltransferase (CCA-adding enzyme)|nr:CCA tRNA nucleotidyltransferase [Thermoproteota archaeon]
MSIEEIIEKAKEKTSISHEERERLNEVVKEVIEKLEEKKKELNLDLIIEVHGSFAHDTWLSGDKDVDIFVLKRSEEVIEEAMKLAKSTFKDYVEKYAEHPYVTVFYKGYNFDIVPAYLLEKGEKIKTATDRSRLHTLYLKEVLNDELRKEIRLLKLFLKTLDLYGAEIKTGGMSGYLCELLIVHYRSFLNLIRSAINWKPYKTIIGEWKGPPEPLVVVDPVDSTRNVASSFKRVEDFKYACILFLENPSLRFFEGRKYSSQIELALDIFEKRGTEVLVIEIEYPKIPPDQFWGEIKRAERSLNNFLQVYDFEILDSLTYSDEEKVAAIILELRSKELKELRTLVGPPLSELKNVKSFIKKHSLEPIFLRNGRLHVLTKRKISSFNEAFNKWIVTQSLPKDLIYPLKNAKIYSAQEANDKGIKRRIFDLAFKDFWWVREDLIKHYNIVFDEI